MPEQLLIGSTLYRTTWRIIQILFHLRQIKDGATTHSFLFIFIKPDRLKHDLKCICFISNGLNVVAKGSNFSESFNFYAADL